MYRLNVLMKGCRSSATAKRLWTATVKVKRLYAMEAVPSSILKAAQQLVLKGEKTWKVFTEAELAAVDELRGQKLPPIEPKASYKLICPACTKPNALEVNFCTGCGFGLVAADSRRVSDNVFLDLINGVDTGTTVHYRDDDYLVFDDRFGVSSNHLQIIPTVVLDDITQLTRDHIPMLVRMYELAIRELSRRQLHSFADVVDLSDVVVCGFNYPVSVKHLHLHAVLPPFKHEKVFMYPRWHSYRKVLADLKKNGCVTTYNVVPCDEEGMTEYNRAILLHKQYDGLVS